MMKIATLKASTILARAASAFENDDGGKWKTDENGKVETKDGNPIYINTAGEEQVIARNTIGRLNSEAQANRKRAETAEASLKAFEGLDADKAREALETVGKLNDKKLFESGEVEALRQQIAEQYTAKIEALTKENGDLNGTVDGMRVDNAFNNSKWVKENIAVPIEMFRSQFGSSCKVENGKVNVYGADGRVVMSKKHIGEPASFDEAMEIIVDGYAHKDAIVKPFDANGTGGNGGGGGRGYGNTMKVADFDKLPPNQQAEIAGKAASGEITIVD